MLSCHLVALPTCWQSTVSSDHPAWSLAGLPFCHRTTLSTCHLRSQLSCHPTTFNPAIQSSCYPVILLFCLPAILPFCHLSILPSCHPVILSSCHPVILSSCHPGVQGEPNFETCESDNSPKPYSRLTIPPPLSHMPMNKAIQDIHIWLIEGGQIHKGEYRRYVNTWIHMNANTIQ